MIVQHHNSQNSNSGDLNLAALDLIGAHVAMLDAEGNIIAVNQAWQNFARQNACNNDACGIGANYLNVCDSSSGPGSEEAKAIAQAIRDIIRRKRSSFWVEYPCHSPDQRRWFQMRVSHYDSTGGARVLVAHENITETKLAHEELRKREEMLTHAARLNTLGEMVTGITHEINQPLAAISVYAKSCLQLLKSTPDLPDNVIENIQKISEQAHRAGAIIKNLHDLAKKRPSIQEIVPLNELLRGVIGICEMEVKQKGANIRCEFDSPPPLIKVDSVQIQQVLLNLIMNALTAIKENRPEERSILTQGHRNSANSVEISVTDQGCGVPDEYENEIFKPFVTSKDFNIGIGLSISKSIVENHGGRIWFSRNVKRGVTFHFTVPLAMEKIE